MKCDETRLEIQGRKYVALGFVLAFLGVLVFVGYRGATGAMNFKQTPVFVFFCLGLTAVILVWAAYDLMFANSFLRLHIPTGQLKVYRKAANRRFRYVGPAKGHLRFEIRTRSSSGTSSQRFHVVYLLAEDDRHSAPYQLGSRGNREDAEALLEEWKTRLRLS